MSADGGAVVSLVGNASITFHLVQQRLGGATLVQLTASEQKAQGPAKRVGEQMDLGRQSTSGTPQSLVLSTPFWRHPCRWWPCW